MSYMQAHRLLRDTYGPARGYRCDRCRRRRAAQWAYVGPRGPSERLPWSLDLSLYVPMCLRCHREWDRAAIRALDRHPADAAMF